MFLETIVLYSLNDSIIISEVCFICSKSLSDVDIVTVGLGIKMFIKSSIERGEGNIYYLEAKKSVSIHRNCRKHCTRKSSTAALNRERDGEEASTSTSPPNVRTGAIEYCSHTNLCIICYQATSEDCEKSKNLKFFSEYDMFRHLHFGTPFLNFRSSMVMI